MKIGYLGLGKMGYNMVARLKEKGHEIVGYDPDEKARTKTAELGVEVADSYAGVIDKLESPRIIWSMIPHAAIDDMLAEVIPLLASGDIIVEAANSQYELTLRRAKDATEKGVHFVDAGVSGGPGGARNGACLMVGSEKEDYEKLVPLFSDISKGEGYYAHLGPAGSGHYAKMIHNGIEYGMMQALGEGAALLKHAPFTYKLDEVFELYNHGSVIESRLVGWARDGLRNYGEGLAEISPTVGHSGEGEWTVKEAKRQGIPVPVIEDSFRYRVDSKDRADEERTSIERMEVYKNPSFYVGRFVNMLRNQFGWHSIKPGEQPGHTKS